MSKVDVTGSCFFSRDWLFTFFTICMLIGDLVKSYLLVICICFLNPDVSVIHRVSLYIYIYIKISWWYKGCVVDIVVFPFAVNISSSSDFLDSQGLQHFPLL